MIERTENTKQEMDLANQIIGAMAEASGGNKMRLVNLLANIVVNILYVFEIDRASFMKLLGNAFEHIPEQEKAFKFDPVKTELKVTDEPEIKH